jgi:membrane fusion protein, multidrug efflux system
MKKIFSILIVVLAVSFVLSGCSKEETSAKSMEQLYKENGVPVKVETVARKLLNTDHTFHAVITGIKESKASAMVADKVEKLHYTVGDVVEKDAVVISFPTDNPAAQYNQAKVGFEHAETTMKRMKSLYENGGISLQDYENTNTQYKVSKANWEAVRQSVKVKAPISGTITQINVQESDNVHPGDNLFTVSQTNKLKAKMWVSESAISSIRKGDNVNAIWNAKTISGRVTQVDMSLNSNMQAFGVVVEFDNSANTFKSGVNAEIVIRSQIGRNTIVVERKNIFKQANESVVFVASNGTASKRVVKVGDATGVAVQIVSGLNEGDQLITEGQMLLTDGDKILITK